MSQTQTRVGFSRRARTLQLAAWLALVVPLATLGFGSDSDAWLVGRAAETIWHTGTYTLSRSIGFPLYELLVTPLVALGGWFMANLVAVASGVALLFALWRLTERGDLRHPLFVVVAILFLPVTVKNGSSTMDYLPALAILVWAYVALRAGRPAVCAILIGLASGFRASSVVFIVPTLLYTYQEGRSWREQSRLLVLAVLTAVLAYSPVLLRYGLRGLGGHIALDPQTRFFIGGYNALQLFGVIPSLFLIASLFYSLRTVGKGRRERWTPEVTFQTAVIGVMAALFVLQPDEPEYLLPAVPFLMMLIDRLLGVRWLALLVVVLLSYHVVRLETVGGESGSRKIELSLKAGLTVADVQDRLFKLATRQAATMYVTAQPTVLMLGEAWIPTRNDAWTPVEVESLPMYKQRSGNLYISNRIWQEPQLRVLRRRGFRLVVWRGEKWELMRAGTTDWRQYIKVIDDLAGFFGRPLSGRAYTQH
jgi:hypothetical protein